MYCGSFFSITKACKQLEVIQKDISSYPSSDPLRRAVAVNQHHDAVTGTEKQHVAYDYAKRLAIGREECQVNFFYHNMGKDKDIAFHKV